MRRFSCIHWRPESCVQFHIEHWVSWKQKASFRMTYLLWNPFLGTKHRIQVSSVFCYRINWLALFFSAAVPKFRTNSLPIYHYIWLVLINGLASLRVVLPEVLRSSTNKRHLILKERASFSSLLSFLSTDHHYHYPLLSHGCVRYSHLPLWFRLVLFLSSYMYTLFFLQWNPYLWWVWYGSWTSMVLNVNEAYMSTRLLIDWLNNAYVSTLAHTHTHPPLPLID